MGFWCFWNCFGQVERFWWTDSREEKETNFVWEFAYIYNNNNTSTIKKSFFLGKKKNKTESGISFSFFFGNFIDA